MDNKYLELEKRLGIAPKEDDKAIAIDYPIYDLHEKCKEITTQSERDKVILANVIIELERKCERTESNANECYDLWQKEQRKSYNYEQENIRLKGIIEALLKKAKI